MAAVAFADVVAGVRATLAAYAHALDDGRTGDIIDTFCADAVAEIGGQGTVEGHDALRTTYAGWVPTRPQRHLIVNTHVSEWDDHTAKATSDVVFLVQRKDGWAIQLVGRYHDAFRNEDGRWRFSHRQASFVPPPA